MTRTELEKLAGHKRHKFGAVRTVCNLGHSHPSKAEAAHCWCLQTQMRGNANESLIVDLEYEKPYKLIVNEQLIAIHRPDFTYKRFSVTVVEGKRLVVATQCIDEVKGVQTPDWKLKFKLMRALYPGIAYRVL